MSPWARGDARSALSMLVGAAGAPLMLFVLALPFGGAELVGRAATALLPAGDGWLELAMRAGDKVFKRGEGVALTAPTTGTGAAAHGQAAATGHAATPPPRPAPSLPPPVVTAARPMAPTRFVSQLEVRLRLPLAAAGLETWRHRTEDGLATLKLELRPEGGCELALTADLTRQVSAPRDGHGYRLLDAFIATYMPAGAGATPDARLAWWRAALDERRAEAERRGQMELGAVWNPTFNIGKRVGQATLEGEAFTLSLYVPPEDPGL